MFIRLKEHESRRVIVITSAIFYFTALFGGVTNPEIQELAIKKFLNYPGFDRLLFSQNKGRFFEMEAALCMQFNCLQQPCIFEKKQDILGFDLELDFDQNIGWYERAGARVFINTAELDVITSDFVIECKCSAKPRSGKCIAQFIKEQNVLAWARWILDEIQTGKMKIKHRFEDKNQCKSMFTLKSTSKKSKSKQIVSCSWINSQNSEECLRSFLKK